MKIPAPLSSCFSARTLGLCALAAALPAQGTESHGQPAKTQPRKTRALTRAEEHAALERARREVFAHMVPKRTAKKGPRARARWLARFQSVQSKHYLLFTDGPRTTSRKFQRSLETLYAFVDRQWPFEDPEDLLTCYVFKTPEEYYDFCVQIAGWNPKSARGTAGHANAAYYATYYQSPTAGVVMHEATHQIVAACMKVPGVGSWFQEGMAVWVQKEIGNEKPAAVMRSRFRQHDYYPLRKLFGLRSLLFDPAGHGRRSYEQAGALIDFLIKTKLKPVAGKFGAFLEAARRSPFGRGAEASIQLVREVYGLSPDELEALWKRHHGLSQ